MLTVSLSRISATMFNTAGVLLVLVRTHSAALAGLTAAATVIPGAVSGPVLGAWLDVARRRRLLVVGDQLLSVVGLVAILVLAGHAPDWTVPVVAMLYSVTRPFSSGSFASALPELAGPELLDAASAVEATSLNLAVVIGPVLAGVLSGVIGPAATVEVQVALTLIVAVLIAINPAFEARPAVQLTSLRAAVGAGLAVLARQPVLRATTISSTAAAFGWGLMLIGFPLYAVRTLHAPAHASGFLWAALAGGSIIGTFGSGPSEPGPVGGVVPGRRPVRAAVAARCQPPRRRGADRPVRGARGAGLLGRDRAASSQCPAGRARAGHDHADQSLRRGHLGRRRGRRPGLRSGDAHPRARGHQCGGRGLVRASAERLGDDRRAGVSLTPTTTSSLYTAMASIDDRPRETAVPTSVLAAAGVSVLLWASAFVGIRYAGRGFAPGPLALGRLIVGSLALGAAMLVRREPVPPRRALGQIVTCGLLWFAVYNVALNAAERRIDAGIAALLVNVGPIFIAILAGIVLREGFPRLLLAGCAVAFSGAALIAISTSRHAGGGAWGPVLCIIAALTYAAGVIAQKPALRHASPLAVTWLACVVGAIACLPFAGGLINDLGHAGPRASGWMVYLGLAPTAIGFLTWAYALSHTAAGRMGSTTYLVPPVALALGWVTLGEVPPWLALPGGVLCLAGVALARWSPRRRPSATFYAGQACPPPTPPARS